MPILDNLTALVDRAQAHRRPGLLALDVSKRAIGLAGADPSWRIATPLGTIRRRRWSQDLAALKEWLAERDAAALLIGWPLNMDGSEGPRCQSVRAFTHNLDAALGLPMLWWDERLSTFAAEDAAERSGRRGKKRTYSIDALAAATFLQDALDAIARAERQSFEKPPRSGSAGDRKPPDGGLTR